LLRLGVVEGVRLARLRDAESDAELRKPELPALERADEPLLSELNQTVSRAFTTNQPSVAGYRPEPDSSSRASPTAKA
jgi:hypothetical protein